MKNSVKSRLFFAFLVSLIVLSNTLLAQKTYKYETVPNDPLNARIYTLDNGLKVYMTVNKDAPRIQTYIACRVGSKNDPSDATGMAHYFEHMMFKGTALYGTLNYEKESVLISKVDSLFEVYRGTKDSISRLKIYHLIDSISYEASKYAIPNEYDKLVATIGASGTNAYTSSEQTVYINEIPSNQLENWLTIESERFRNPVLRLFHTELETVYEEKNMTLASDGRKANTALNAGLFQKHTYGTQTTIGTIEHLKNPSMKKLREFYAAWYVPNNMAIVLSGDIDPDAAIKLIDEKFGNYKKKEVPSFTFEKEDPITAPIVKEVIGPEAESVYIGFRFNGASSKEAEMLYMISMILSNGQAGLLDLNLNQAQKVLNSYAYAAVDKDYSALVFYAKPKEGQKLEDLKDLLLSQLELVKNGSFPDWVLPAIINDMKFQEMQSYEKNSGRGSALVQSFILDIPWKDEVNSIDRFSKITKNEIIEFVKKNFSANNYVVVYKRTGIDNNIPKITKPKITTIKINRDFQSDFLKQIEINTVPKIEPVFLDYEKDITKFNIKSSVQVLYKENTDNKLFNLYYLFDMGTNSSKMLEPSMNYLKLLGTSKYTPAELRQEFYKIGCTYNVSVMANQTYISLRGLSENLEKAMILLESLLADAQPQKDALDNLISNTLKSRKDAKLNKQSIFNALTAYGMYGPISPFTYKLTENELKSLKPEELIGFTKDLFSFQHRILYYGNLKPAQIKELLNKYHKIPNKLKSVLPEKVFVQLPTDTNKVYQVDFPMKQVDIVMMSKGVSYDKSLMPDVQLYNEYFGGGMSSIVFQELREARALAYTARSTYQGPADKNKCFYDISYIGTQTDKLGDALTSLEDLLNNMPEANKNFLLAQNTVIEGIRSKRTTKTDVLWSYENAKKYGHTYDIRKDIFNKVPLMTFADVKKFQETYVKNKTHTILLVGDKKLLDFSLLAKYGNITYLTLEDVFGY
jgi:predicted Zn-dependent peptidase